MRIPKNQSDKLKAKAYRLYDKGKTYREIAQILGVTEKTAGVWVKPYKEYKSEVKQTKTNAVKRLNKALQENAPNDEIKALCDIVARIKAF